MKLLKMFKKHRVTKEDLLKLKKEAEKEGKKKYRLTKEDLLKLKKEKNAND